QHTPAGQTIIVLLAELALGRRIAAVVEVLPVDEDAPAVAEFPPGTGIDRRVSAGRNRVLAIEEAAAVVAQRRRGLRAGPGRISDDRAGDVLGREGEPVAGELLDRPVIAEHAKVGEPCDVVRIARAEAERVRRRPARFGFDPAEPLLAGAGEAGQ